MTIDILSAVPKLMESFFQYSILKRAIEKRIVEINLIDIRDYSSSIHKKIDDYAYGGAAGLVLMVEPIFKAIEYLKNKKQYDEIIYFAPEGEVLNQKILNQYSLKKNILLLCGHYKGIDQRIRDNLISKEMSLGSFVLSGGELPAAVFVDGIVRLIPGVLNNSESALTDSFQDDLVSAPVYTRPVEFNGWKVPSVLLNGNHKEINKWNESESVKKTKKNKKV